MIPAREHGALMYGPYRYKLWRVWGDGTGVTFIMLNPSVAGDVQDDPTVRRCAGFAQRWGFAHMTILNLFAWVETSPAQLAMAYRRGADVVGPRNDSMLLNASREGPLVVAWGALPAWARYRELQVRALLGGSVLHCLGTTKQGHPRHPLYLRSDTALEVWSPRG